MFHPTIDIHTYFQPGKRVHLAGIGGVSMCALAEVLQGMGVAVQFGLTLAGLLTDKDVEKKIHDGIQCTD